MELSKSIDATTNASGQGLENPVSDDDAAEVIMYSLPGCGSCFFARRLLRRRGIKFTEISGASQPDFRRRLLKKTGGSTVPQVLIDGEAIGGGDSLSALDRAGVLRPLIGGETFPVVQIRRRGLFRRRFEVATLERDGTVLNIHDASSNEQAEAVAADLRTEIVGV